MKRLKKILFRRNRINRIWGCLILIVLGLGIMAYGGRIFIGYMIASKELTSCKASEVENGYYKFTDVWTVLGSFGYDENGKGYILWIKNQYDIMDRGFFMAMYFSDEDRVVAEKITNAFWDAYDNHTESDVYLSGAGRVRNMRDDEIEVFKTAIREIYGDDSFKDHVIYKTLEYKVFPRQMSIEDWITVIGGFALIIFAIYGMFAFGKNERRKILNKVERSRIDPDQLAYDIIEGKKYGKIVVSKNAVFNAEAPYLIFLKDITGCYGEIAAIKQKFLGLVSVGSRRLNSVILVEKNGKTTALPAKNEKIQQEAIEAILSAVPDIDKKETKNKFSYILSKSEQYLNDREKLENEPGW